MDKKKVYFAGPLFCKAEKNYNLFLTEILESYDYKVFLPQRDGHEAASEKMAKMTAQEKVRLIFEKDTNEIQKADIIFMVLDGRVPDEGACVELGYAFALGKSCYGIRTDMRAMELDLELNPLIAGCFIKIFSGKEDDEAIIQLQEYLETNKL